MTAPADRFDELVIDAATRLERRWGPTFPQIQFAVEVVPPSDPAPWEDDDVPLGRLFPGGRGIPSQIVLYRRPIETRSHDAATLALLVDEIVTEQVAACLGVPPEELDPGFGRHGH